MIQKKLKSCTWVLFTFIIALSGTYAFSQNSIKSFSPGAYIIDMGQPDQTIENGIKPYGLVYQLIAVDEIPVNWAIKSSKIKDGADFSADGKSYGGGSFIIEADRVTPAVIAKIDTWKAKGVIVNGPVVNAFTAPVYKVLTSWPRAILDAQTATGLIVPFYDNAEIPKSSYVTVGNPTMLTNCGDVYVLPHADPQNWTKNSGYVEALQNFINNDGYLWVGCHAVSALESITGCNFLSNEGLALWSDHAHGTPPYTYTPSTASDPIMQFIGTLDASTQNGSEQVFIPKAAGWRNTTTIAVSDQDYPQIGSLSPGPAAIVAYGRAFGTKGMVMIEAGHALNNGTVSSRVAAQRAFFNYLLMAGIQKQLIANVNFPDALIPGTTYKLSATVSGGVGQYHYLWSSNGGKFSDSTANPTTFTAPASIDNCIIKLTISDDCGRTNFISSVVSKSQVIPVNVTLRDTSHEGHIDRIDISWTDSSIDLTNISNVANFIKAASITSLDGQNVTLHPINIVPDIVNKTIYVILQENKSPICETGWQSAKISLENQTINVQGDTLTVTKVIDGAGPVVTRAHYNSTKTTGTLDTLKITISEPVDCNTILNALPSEVFVIFDNGKRNDSALAGAEFTGSCSSKYTSVFTIAVKRDAFVIPNADSIAFIGEAIAVLDQYGNHPGINNRGVRLETGIINNITIGTSTNPFIPGVTTIPPMVLKYYDKISPTPSSTGIIIGIKSDIPLKEIANQTYGNADIYDAVGNIVITNIPIKKSSSGYYGLYWDGYNHNNRKVGLGTYAVMLTIKDITGKSEKQLVKIGIKGK